MLFLTYWELNEGMSVEERQQVAQKLMSAGLFPPRDVNILRWDATPMAGVSFWPKPTVRLTLIGL